MAIDKSRVKTHGPPHAFNSFVVLAQTKLSNSQSVQRAPIVRVNSQSPLKSFSRLGKPNNGAISNSKVYVGPKIIGVEINSLFVSLNGFGVASHSAVNITQ